MITDSNPILSIYSGADVDEQIEQLVTDLKELRLFRDFHTAKEIFVKGSDDSLGAIDLAFEMLTFPELSDDPGFIAKG